MPLVDFLASLGAWNWLILAVVLFALETVVPGVYLAWFGFAAVLVGLFGLTTDFAWQWQMVAFALLAVASVFAARRFTGARAQPSDLPDLNVRGAQYVGRVVTVEEPIRFGRGKVRIGDTLWQAEGADAPVGAQVRVTGARDTILQVQAV